jgi:hypothetical protein
MTASEGVAAATQQSLFREVNERIAELSGRKAFGGKKLELLCECADDSCTEPLTVTLDEYKQVRAVPTHFIVSTGHVVPNVERVVHKESNYFVVEKIGEAGATAEQLDPRRRSDPSRP